MTTTINNEHKKLNVPNLRFPEFQGEWEKFTFDEIAQYKKGPFGSALKKDLFVPQSENAIKVYEQQNAIKKDCTLSRYYITKDYFNTHMKQFVAKAGDLIVSCAGTIGEVYELPKDAEEGVFNQALMRVRVNNEIVNKEIFITVFSSMIDKFSKIYSNGSAIKNIPPFADLKRTQVYLPCKEEQIVIAQLLRSLDERIATQSKIIEDLKKLKSAIIEKHYCKVEKQIACVGDLGEPFSVGNLAKDDLTETGIPCVIYGELFTTYGETISQIESHTYKTEGIILSKKGDLLFPSSTTVDAMSLIAPSVINMDGVILGGDMFGIHISPNFNAQYLSYYFNHIAKRQLAKFAKGSTIIHLHYADIEKAKLLLPSLEEQNRVAKCLVTLDDKIKKERTFFDLLNSQKAYLLCHMFI